MLSSVVAVKVRSIVARRLTQASVYFARVDE